jgi:hypothetical protein
MRKYFHHIHKGLLAACQIQVGPGAGGVEEEADEYDGETKQLEEVITT